MNISGSAQGRSINMPQYAEKLGKESGWYTNNETKQTKLESDREEGW